VRVFGKHEFVYNTFGVVNSLRYIGAELTAEMVEGQFQNAKELLFSES